MARDKRRTKAVHSTEIELKLAVAPAAMTRLKRAPTLAAKNGPRGRPRQIVTTYYDTPQLTIFERGTALRIRREAGTLTQTLKAQRENGALARSEWSSPLDTPDPDLERLAASNTSHDLGDLEEALLKPLFTSRIRRQTRIIEAPSPEGGHKPNRGRLRPRRGGMR